MDIVSQCFRAELAKEDVYAHREYDRIELRCAHIFQEILSIMSAHGDYVQLQISKQGVELIYVSENADWIQRCVCDTSAIIQCTWEYIVLPEVTVVLNTFADLQCIEQLFAQYPDCQDMNLVFELYDGHSSFKIKLEPFKKEVDSTESSQSPMHKMKKQRRAYDGFETSNSRSSLSLSYHTFEEQDDDDRVRLSMITEQEEETRLEQEKVKMLSMELHQRTKNDRSQITHLVNFSEQDQKRQQGQPVAPFVIHNYPHTELDNNSWENAFINSYARFRCTRNQFEMSTIGESGILQVSLYNQQHLHNSAQEVYENEYMSEIARLKLSFGSDMLHCDFWTYKVDSSKRQTIQVDANWWKQDPAPFFFTRIARFHLVPFFTAACWKRYGYSVDDIQQTSKAFRSCLLWLVAIKNRNQLESSAVKQSHAVEYVMIWGAKQAAIKTNMKHIPNIYPESQFIKNSVLCKDFKDHKPCLPKVTLDALMSHIHPAECFQLDACLKSLPSHTELCASYYKMAQVYQWKDILVTPRRKEGGNRYLCFVRVLPEDVYKMIHGEPTCIALQPQRIETQNGFIYSLTEEAFLVPISQIKKHALSHKSQNDESKRTIKKRKVRDIQDHPQ